MKCFLAFGTTNRQAPYVRDEGEGEWPDTELHNGVAHVYLEDHGDAPGEILIKVYGTSEEVVRKAWDTAKARIPQGGFIR